MDRKAFGFLGGGKPTPPPGNAPPQYQHRGNVASFVLKIDNAPNQSYVIDNVVAVPQGTFTNGQTIIVDNKFVFTARVARELPPGVLGLGGAQRDWGQWSLRDEVSVSSFDIFSAGHGQVYLGSLDLEIDFYSKNRVTQNPFEQEQLAKRMLQLFENQIFSPGQKFVLEMAGMNFRVTVMSTQVVDLGAKGDDSNSQFTQKNQRGILLGQTEINFFKAPNGLINLKSSGNKPRANAILTPNFKFEDLGIGGLDEEFNTIFRRAFASRIYPPRDVEKLGISHVKGLLLFGPPGTGKTLIARQIGKMLNAVEPKIVNGPEMLNKYVGGSEENIRNLFKDAEAEFKAKGEESNLHIIIFDELDAVFKQRGSRGDGTGVGDNVVNQLLAKMDGVDQLNNILVIGMTNRKDLIDSALLRPGRFEVHLEISLPDEKGRRQIFKIHTAKMRHEKKLGKDVSLEELASLTKNFSGAEIEGLVKSAASFALNRNIKMDPVKGIMFDSKKEVMVVREDFLKALEENKPAFGVSEEDLAGNVRGGIIKYSPYIEQILDMGTKLIQQVKESDQFPLISVLIHGPSGSGKTALASSIALSSGFPFIRFISPEAMIGMNETARVQYLNQMFQDSYKSPLNAIVIDQIEDVMDWVNIGPRFSNSVLQTLKVFLRKFPPKDRKLIIFVTTTQRSILEQMDLLKGFNKEIHVPSISSLDNLNHIFQDVGFLDPQSRQRAVSEIQKETDSSVLGIGIKNILFNIEAAKLSGAGNELQEFIDLTSRDILSQPGRQYSHRAIE